MPLPSLLIVVRCSRSCVCAVVDVSRRGFTIDYISLKINASVMEKGLKIKWRKREIVSVVRINLVLFVIILN